MITVLNCHSENFPYKLYSSVYKGVEKTFLRASKAWSWFDTGSFQHNGKTVKWSDTNNDS